VIIIDIKNWTREESYYDKENEELYIKTAFGNEEYEAVFPTRDILGILDENGVLLYAKTYYLNEDKKKEEKPKIDNEGAKRSMETMLKRNKHLLGAKK
jgi:hypothetical protein